MNAISTYPGTPRHQALLSSFVTHYRHDPRVRAVIVFGSLGRGNWDEYSDLDLDVIVADDARLDVPAELLRLCEAFAALGERAAIILPDGADAGDIVLESLAQLSIRYHLLALTSPNIIDTMIVLAGSLEPAQIAVAGNANCSGESTPLDGMMDQCARYAAVANVAFQRGQLWAVMEILHRMRALLMDLFARTHGGYRGYQFFDRTAGEELQRRLGETLPRADAAAVRQAFLAMLDLLENDLAPFTNGQAELSGAQKNIINRVRQTVALPGA